MTLPTTSAALAVTPALDIFPAIATAAEQLLAPLQQSKPITTEILRAASS